MKRSSSIRTWLTDIAIVVGILALMWGAVALWTQSTWSITRTIDDRVIEANRAYSFGTFSEATNTITRCIEFLEAHGDRPSVQREVQIDYELFVKNSRLGYIMMYAGDADAASDLLCKAYPYRKRISVKAGKKPEPKEEFVDFVLTSNGKMDALYGAACLAGLSLESNVVTEVKDLFAERINVN